MSHLRNPIFTDVIKDVICDYPVIDQFEIDYYASFYESMQDDYVTGSFLQYRKREGGGYTFLSSSRGVAFSKTYASEATANIENVVGNYTRLSKRLVPFEDITSKNNFRITQCVDQNERFYDSCLPNISDCFDINKAKVWTVSNSGGAAGFLSPVNTAQTSSIGYMFFNAQLNNGLEMNSNSVLTNNEWTWSYPFEGKYKPKVRFVKLKDVLGVDRSNVRTKWKNSTEVVPFQQATVGTSTNFISMFPILPGNLTESDIAPNGLNAVKLPFVDFEKEKIESIIPLTSSFGSLGTSWLIPSDVYVKQGITSSLSDTDMTKFLFGFGDLNNMAHTSLKFVDPGSGSAYTESFSWPASVGNYWETGPGVITSAQAGFTLDWTKQLRNNSSFVAGVNYVKPWMIARAEGTIVNKTLPYTGDESSPYRYQYVISGSNSTPNLSSSLIGRAGLYWAWSGTSTNQVLISDSSLFGGTQKDSPDTEGDSAYFTMSAAVVDVTCSYDWSFSYSRAVSCDKSDGLFVWLANFPDNLYPDKKVVPIDFLTGSGTAVNASTGQWKPGKSIGILKRFHLLEHDTHANIPLSNSIRDHFENGTLENDGMTSWPECEKRKIPLPSGSYRIVFSYLKSGSTTTQNKTSFADRAAIDWFRIYTYPDQKACFFPDETSPTVGANNYPEFRKTFVDSRMTSASYYEGSPEELTGSIYTNSSYNFGVSPIIRGWKYGLINGFSTYSKAVFRNRRFGHLRDMLEQRQYGKFVKVKSADAFQNPAIVFNDAEEFVTGKNTSDVISKSPVTVKFVKRQYFKDDRNIGTIYNTSVEPVYTTSQNLSSEVTSSVPYADGEARNRTEASYNQVIDMSTKWTGPVRKLTREY